MKSGLNHLLPVGVELSLLLPLAWLIFDSQTGGLTADPVRGAIQRTGQISLVVLLLSLAVTPLNYFFHSSDLARLRRTVGLYAFFYVLLHFLSFTGLDYGFEWGFIWPEITQKPYLMTGLLAFLLLVPLAVTSFGMWRRGVGRQWTALHRLVYLAAVLAVLHALWTVKGNPESFLGDGPRLLAVISLVVLLLLRLPPIRRWIERRVAGQS